jgi:CheY-like chemotaxis protein
MKSELKSDCLTVLVIDDDIVDRMAIERAFKKLHMPNPIIEAVDGVEALERLRGENGHEKPRQPLVALLDLNMPRMGGIEFLDAIRADPQLRSTLVFVLTTSRAPMDRYNAYARNIAGYFLKQSPSRTFLETIEKLARYWGIIEFTDPAE